MFAYYDINFYRLATQLLPKWMRKPKMLVFVKAMISPMVFIHNDFVRYRAAKRYQLEITSQVCYLEKFLNDRFDYTLRRITIVDADWKDAKYVFKRAEQKPVYFRKRIEATPVVIYTRGESGDVRDDFVINVPMDVVFDSAEMRAMVDSNICGKRYKIQRF